ncbi:MAG: type IV pilus biogenesis/stability protein PilW [Rhodocyclaceae bacterium]|nr:type IV pilus biogenesis/stability protein PilW [Rhodocyclaceae bacterium]
MTLKSTALSFVALALFVSGCAGTPDGNMEFSGVEQAASRQAATSDAGKRAMVHTELGRLYLQEGSYEVALERARVAIDAESGYAPAHNLLALVYMTLRQNHLAEQSFRRALQLAPGDPEINNDFGWFLCQTGKPKESNVHFRVAIANPLHQSPGKALTNAGLCAVMSKDDRLAEEYLVRAVRLDRANLTALFWLADITYRSNRLDDARQIIKDLHARLDPTSESAWLALRIERKLGDREAEARFTGILHRKYRGSPEQQKLSRGEFD